MSVIHINQIKSRITNLFKGKIDLTDVTSAKSSGDEFFLTRGLAAYAIYCESKGDIGIAAKSIVDGSEDNGIDAVHYNSREKILYIVQSKWITSGTREPSNGDIKKFIGGIKDLFDLKFERFNKKILSLKEILKEAISDPQTTYKLIIAYTGVNSLATPSQRDLDDLLTEMNDTSELVFLTIMNQKYLHDSLVSNLSGDPINLRITLTHWGRIEDPYLAYYGQVSVEDILKWWKQHKTYLFSKNIRSILGDTEINNEVKNTLINNPKKFWYFNNGITLVCKKISKTMEGGSDRDFGHFECEDISIVNGAQTVGTIGKYLHSTGNSLNKASLPIRIISLENAEKEFGEEITKANNKQNKIENRDFVSLDTEQLRIQTDLALEGIKYNIIRSETNTISSKAFDLVESTTALACASLKVGVVVQLKREISRLWDDITKGMYKQLFNKETEGLYVWRCVQVQRKIDKAIEKLEKIKEGREYGILVHGNRFLSYLVFSLLETKKFKNPDCNFKNIITTENITKLVSYSYIELSKIIEEKYDNSMLPTLFKNQTKCTDISDTLFIRGFKSNYR